MLLGLIFLALTVLLLPFALELRYNRFQADSETVIVLWIWKLPLKLRIAYLEKIGRYLYAKVALQAPGSAAEIEPAIPLKRILQLLKAPMPRLLKALAKSALFFLEEIEKLEVRLRYSTGEAAATAIAAGAAWWITSVVLPTLNARFVFLHQPQVHVTPVFGPQVFELYLRCIFRIRLGYIMVKRIKQRLQFGKGG